MRTIPPGDHRITYQARQPVRPAESVAMPSDLEGRFRTHARYIEAFAMLAGLGQNSGDLRALQDLQQRAFTSGCLSDSASGTIDYSQVQRSLNNAWGTELLLAMASRWDAEDEFVRLTNTWGVVQAYYVGYHQTQALIVARGAARPSTHPNTQNQFVDLWVKRNLDLAPWTFGVIRGNAVRNLPSGATLDWTTHPWSTCDRASCWSLAAKALASTREESVKQALRHKREDKQRDSRRDWEQEEARRTGAGRRARRRPQFPLPRLNAAEKSAVEHRVRGYSILDYLYRLRIRANYDDASIFTDGPIEDLESAILNRRLRYTAAATSLVTELRIRELVGRPKMMRWIDDFVATNIPAGLTVGLSLRRDLIDL